MSRSVTAALEAFIERYLTSHRQRHGGLPRQVHDPRWPSACRLGDPGPGGLIHWRPVRREGAADFTGMEHALDVPVHQDFKDFFGTFWGDSLGAHYDGEVLSLLQVWNDEDFDRLIANLLGHALAKSKRRQPLTLFFACVDDPELLLSLENGSGKVLLEHAARGPLRDLEPSLAAFLDRLTPDVDRDPDAP